MPFSDSCENIKLNGSVLKASCRKLSDEFVDAEIDLNDILGNTNGNFVLGEKGWHGHARNAKIHVSNNSCKLTAMLERENGEYQEAEIELDDVIESRNGELKAVVDRETLNDSEPRHSGHKQRT